MENPEIENLAISLGLNPKAIESIKVAVSFNADGGFTLCHVEVDMMLTAEQRAAVAAVVMDKNTVNYVYLTTPNIGERK